jgi:hypothetical protein
MHIVAHVGDPSRALGDPVGAQSYKGIRSGRCAKSSQSAGIVAK